MKIKEIAKHFPLKKLTLEILNLLNLINLTYLYIESISIKNIIHSLYTFIDIFNPNYSFENTKIFPSKLFLAL